MTVSITVKGNTEALEGLEVYLDDLQENAKTVARATFNKVEPFILDELRFYPPVPPNSTYKRTFRLRQGWHLEFDETSGGFRFVIRNRVPYTQWVVGSLAQKPSVAARFQRDYHARNGWPLATETASFWIDAFAETFNDDFVGELGEFASTSITRRAATRIR